jgi:hypothetical protein
LISDEDEEKIVPVTRKIVSCLLPQVPKHMLEKFFFGPSPIRKFFEVICMEFLYSLKDQAVLARFAQ